METKDLQKKKSNPYKVRTISKAVKDMDIQNRTVTGIFNSYFYIDSDLDMLLPGAAAKSIQERGVGSTKGNKIKHLKDHDWSKNIARIDLLEERKVTIDGKQIEGIYHESYYPESQDSTDQLIKIQEGLYDSRSIGFQYVNLVLAEKESEDENRRDNWNTYLPMAMNPEVAEEYGFFWVVKEVKLWEGSDVSFGANELTPMLGMKSGDKDLALSKLNEKLDDFYKFAKSGKLSDDGFHRLDMEIKQIKTYIATLAMHKEPFKKDTPLGRRQPANAESEKSKQYFTELLLKL